MSRSFHRYSKYCRGILGRITIGNERNRHVEQRAHICRFINLL